MSGLETENERLRIDNNIKEQNITKLLNELKVLKEKSDEQELRIKNLENEKAHFLKQIKESDQLHTFRILDDEAIESFEKVEEIGHGSSGKVFKIRKKKYYAKKEIHEYNENDENFRQLFKEYEILNELQHPNIVQAFGILLNSVIHKPCIILEYCPRNLQTAIKQNILSNEQIVTSIYQIAEAMKYIHFNNLIHRDLNPKNILIEDDGTIKISDFGASKLVTSDDETMTMGIGTHKYMAPEIINEEDNCTEKVDVYSFGVVVFFILSGGEVPKIKIGEILQGKKEPLPKEFTDFAQKLIYDCWNFESKDRPSFEEIVDQMRSNHYELMELTKSEATNVELFIQNHKAKIPHTK